jgi:hypothetical protein
MWLLCKTPIGVGSRATSPGPASEFNDVLEKALKGAESRTALSSNGAYMGSWAPDCNLRADGRVGALETRILQDYSAACMSGASMKPPDCRRQRAA